MMTLGLQPIRSNREEGDDRDADLMLLDIPLIGSITMNAHAPRTLLLALGLLAIIATGCSGSDSEPTPTSVPTLAPTPRPTATPGPVTVTGRIALRDRDWARSGPREGGHCSGMGGYNDIREGMEARLYADDELVDVGHLGEGTFGPDPEIELLGRECIFSFEVDVPRGARFYRLELGRRGEFTYTFEEITAPDGLAYQLGP